jgi:hypothetical protein
VECATRRDALENTAAPIDLADFGRTGGRGGPQKDANGYPVFPAGSKITMAIMMGKARSQTAAETGTTSARATNRDPDPRQ